MSGRYNGFGQYTPTCDHCGSDMYHFCLKCMFPQFTPLGGMHMLAVGLLAHYGIDRDWGDADAAELERIIGDELLDIGREFLQAKGLWSQAEPVAGAEDRQR